MMALRVAIALYAAGLAACTGLLGVHDPISDDLDPGAFAELPHWSRTRIPTHPPSDGEPFALLISAASQGVAQQPLDTITVAIRDIGGKPATKFTGEVVLSMGHNPSGGTLLGTLIGTADEGIARFDFVGIDKPGQGYTRVASIEGIPAATTSAIDVVAPRFTPVATGIPGGVISSIAVSPAPAGGTATVFAGAPDGVYKSVDGGASWKLASFGGDVAEQLVADPNHPGVVYLDNRNHSSFQKTIDGGATWHGIKFPFLNSSVDSFALDPRNPSVIYAAGMTMRRSADGGASWIEFASQIGCGRIVVDPVRTDTLYCAAYDASSGQSAGVYKSTNAGATWGPANNGLPSFNSGILLATPKGVFVAVDDALYRSLDAGASWTTAYPMRSFAIAYALSMPDRVYLSHDRGISISNDGGASFGAPVDPGDFVGSLAVDPTSPNLVYGAGASGVVISTNGGVSWSASSTGLDAHWVASVAIAAGTANTVLTTTGAAVLRSDNGGTSWTTVPRFAVTAWFDPAVSTRAYLCGYQYFATSNNSGASFPSSTVTSFGNACDRMVTAGTRFFAVAAGRLWKSIDSGANWADVASGTGLTFYDVALGDAIGDVVVALTSDGVSRSINGGTSFTPVLGGDHSRDNVVADPTVPGRVVLGCPGFRVSNDGGANFGAATEGGCASKMSSAGSALYAAGPDSEGTSVLTSIDGGSIWTTIHASGIRRGVSVTSLAASDDGETIYLGTTAGLYKGAAR